MLTPQIHISQSGSAPAVVSLSGEHDLSTSPELDVALTRAVVAGFGVVVDLSEATFIDVPSMDSGPSARQLIPLAQPRGENGSLP
jgi:hypothetical protein